MTAEKPRTIRTVLHTYLFDTGKPEQAAAWHALKETLKDGPRCMESHGGPLHIQAAQTIGAQHTGSAYVSIEVVLATDFLSDNQWSATGPNGKSVRVFDWALDSAYAFDNTGRSLRKQGHWLEQTEEMRAIRANTFVCGYCGHKEPRDTAGAFCSKCLTKGSDHLKESDLHMLRMLPVRDSFGAKRAPLTAAERAEVLPRFITAQLTGHDPEKATKEIAAGMSKADAAVARAAKLRAGWEFIAARKITTKNLICYDHRVGKEAVFTWGWMGDGMPLNVAQALAAQLADMPAPWEIVTGKGKDDRIVGGGA